MATKNKKDTVTDLVANIYDNVNREITPTKNKVPFNDIINSVAFNVSIAQLRLEDDSAEHSLAHIIDAGKQGLFYYDSNDLTTLDDGVTCIVTSTAKRYKRSINRKFDNRWTGSLNPYFDTAAAANSAIPMPVRFLGMEVDILITGGILTTYWYRDGVDNVNLIIKGSEIYALDFTIGDGGTYTPADNTDTLTNPLLVGRTILFFIYGNTKLKVTISPATLSIDSTYAQYDAAAGTLKLKNGVYSIPTDGTIIYK